MPVPRRLPPDSDERLATVVEYMTPGALRGQSRMLGAITNSEGLRSQRGGAAQNGGSGLFWNDDFTATAGAQTVTLTYLPRLHSEHVYLNGLQLHEGVEWSRVVSSRDVLILAPADAGAGDWINVEYAFNSASPLDLT